LAWGKVKTKKENDGEKQGCSGTGDCRALALALEYGHIKNMGSP
jgi:hypothetical protein